MAEPPSEFGGRRVASGEFGHVPVLLDRVLEMFDPVVARRADAVLVDATLGMGGHSEAMLDRYPQAQVIGLDRDRQALSRSAARLAPYGTRVHLVHAVYDQLGSAVDGTDAPRNADPAAGPVGVVLVDGVLFDLGVSSLQLDDADRGFSYARPAPLDMRMDQSTGISAADVVNGYSVGALARVLTEYGEERFALRIARAIVAARPVTDTAELAELVRTAIPAATRRTGGHPAKRTFQALRIEVNDELGALRAALPAALARLRVGGRLVALTYHSLEDRLVKRAIAEGAVDRTPPGMPMPLPEAAPWLAVITRGGEQPTVAEIEANPRAASARLRVAERIRCGAGGSR